MKKIHVEEYFSQENQGLFYSKIKTKETKTVPKILLAAIFSLKHRSLIHWNKLTEV